MLKQQDTQPAEIPGKASIRQVLIYVSAGVGLGIAAKFADEGGGLLGPILSSFAPYALILALLARQAPGVAQSIITTICFFVGLLVGYYGAASVLFHQSASPYQGAWLLVIGVLCVPVAALVVLARKRLIYSVSAHTFLAALALADDAFGRFILFLQADPSVNSRGVLVGAADALVALVIVFLLPSWRTRTLALIFLGPAYLATSALVDVPYQLGLLG